MGEKYVVVQHDAVALHSLEDAKRWASLYGGRVARVVFIDDETEQKQETAKIRVALAIGHGGYWQASGWASDMTDSDYDKHAMDMACDGVINPASYWIEKNMPIPQVKTVEADVVEAKE